MTDSKPKDEAKEDGFSLVRWAQRQTGITSPVHMSVLVALAIRTKWDKTEEGYLSFPSQKTLAADTRYSERAVRMALDWLEAKGYLRREHKQRANGSRTSDRIFLLPDRLAHQRHDVPVGSEPTGTSDQAYRNLIPILPAGDSGPTTFEPPGELPEEDSSDPGGSAPQRGAGSPGFRKDLFERGVRTVRCLTGRPEVKCRTLIGKWLALVDDDAATVLATIDAAQDGELADPVSWIEVQLHAAARRKMPGRQFNAPMSNGAVALFVRRMGQRFADPPRSGHEARLAPDDRATEALRMVERGEWPSGGTVFVAAESPEGAAWEAHFERLGRPARWRPLDRGLGWFMPSALPPKTPATADAAA